MSSLTPSNNSDDLIIIGASTRAAAFSALRAGMSPVCLDMYADQDLQQVAQVTKVDDFPAGVSESLKSLDSTPTLYVGGMENHAQLLQGIEDHHTLWGNNPEAINSSRNPETIADVLRLARAECPEWRSSDDPPEAEGTWVLRPLSGCGGRGIVVWDESAADHATLKEPHAFQRLIQGVSYSAVFVAYDGVGDIRFVGVTKQRVGNLNSNAAPFQWCGNIGPVTLSVAVEHTVRRVGNVLKWKTGMKGIFGIDFILDQEERIWVTEVNPRYPASTEILEHYTGVPLLVEHVRSFAPETELKSTWSESHSSEQLGKAILFSPCDFTMNVELQNPVSAETFPEIADVPPVGTEIKIGDPICTVFAHGNSVDECESALNDRLQAFLTQCLPESAAIS